jgi:hypothetical protein
MIDRLYPWGKPGSAFEAGAWAANADALAEWAWRRLAHRLECWGGYRPPEEWGKTYRRPDGTTGTLGQQTTHKGILTRGRLARHFRARSRAEVIGLHSTTVDNTSKAGGLDIDWHGPESTAPAVNLRAALTWHERLARMGFRPLLVDSNARGGFHLRILLAAGIITARVYHFLKRLIADHAAFGMAAPPETFPKQAAVRPRLDGSPGFGNWLRLPGRHHTRDVWSRVWNGSDWLAGQDAIDHILSLRGDSPDLIPEPPPPPVAPPRTCRATPPVGGNLSACITAYMSKLPHRSEGQGRDDVAFGFAAFLVKDMALADAEALDWLARWDAGNSPPKGDARLKEVLANAHLYGRRAVGCGLRAASRRRSPAPASFSFEV